MADARGDRHRHPRILLNALALRPRGSGVQTYARELLRHLPDAWPDAALTALVAQNATSEVDGRIETRVRRARPDHGFVRKLLSLGVSSDGYDLVHGLDADIPLRSHAPTVATVHDLALFDAPWAFARVNRFAKAQVVAQSIRRADVLVSVSAFTAERLRTRFRRDSTVIHEAPAPEFAPPAAAEIADARLRYNLDGPFVLHVGNLEPRKDVAVLARACLEAEVPLVLVGGAISSVKAPPSARVLGYVPNADLAALYAAATVVAYVSRYEGFGLPPIEAMACGAVVAATRVGALPELAAGGIEFVPIGDGEGQAKVLRELVADRDRRSELRSAALRAVSQLSWRRAAEETVAVYRGLTWRAG